MKLKTILLLVCILVTAGCGNYQLVKDRSNQYMQAEEGRPIVVPEWYSERRLKDRYPVPQADKTFVEVNEFIVPAPPEPDIGMLQERFVVKTVRQDTWLLASEPPGKVWPALKAYWEFYGGEVEELSTSTGQMSVTFRSTSAKGRDFMQKNDLFKFGPVTNFGITVDQGLKRRSSEIRINTLVGQTVKQSTEKQLLTGVSHFLSNRAASFESYSLAAQNIGSGDKLALVNEGDHLYLKVDLKFERAWYAVGEALARSHIPIVDWNRKEGIYYVSYEANTKQEGWFPNLFSLNDRSQASDSFNFIIELNADTTDADTTDGVYIESVPVSGSADSQDRIRLLNQLLDHMS